MKAPLPPNTVEDIRNSLPPDPLGDYGRAMAFKFNAPYVHSITDLMDIHSAMAIEGFRKSFDKIEKTFEILREKNHKTSKTSIMSNDSENFNYAFIRDDYHAIFYEDQNIKYIIAFNAYDFRIFILELEQKKWVNLKKAFSLAKENQHKKIPIYEENVWEVVYFQLAPLFPNHTFERMRTHVTTIFPILSSIFFNIIYTYDMLLDEYPEYDL